MSTGKTKKLVIVLWCDTKCCHRDEELFESLDHWLQQPEDQQIIDHTTSEQYRSAMTQECADAARVVNLPITSYLPTARSLLVTDEAVQGQMKRKFDICYVMVRESLVFCKYPALHELEEHHGVDLGFAYKTQDSTKTFTHYIAESQQQRFLDNASSVKFYSFFMDGSLTQVMYVDELVLIQYCTTVCHCLQSQ